MKILGLGLVMFLTSCAGVHSYKKTNVEGLVCGYADRPGKVASYYTIDACREDVRSINEAANLADQERIDREKVEAEERRLASIKAFNAAQKFKDAAIRKDFMVGMPEPLLLLSMGDTEINYTNYRGFKRKQYAYCNRVLKYSCRYVYVQDGEVIGWN